MTTPIPLLLSKSTNVYRENFLLLKAVLTKEALTDSPLLIIKENINCGNFMNKDRVNFFTGKVNHMPLIDFPQNITVVDERLYGETLFS